MAVLGVLKAKSLMLRVECRLLSSDCGVLSAEVLISLYTHSVLWKKTKKNTPIGWP